MNSCYQLGPNIFRIHREVTLKALASSRLDLDHTLVCLPCELGSYPRLPLPHQSPPVNLPRVPFLPQPRLEGVIHRVPFSWPLFRVWGNKGRRDVSMVQAWERQDTRGTER